MDPAQKLPMELFDDILRLCPYDSIWQMRCVSKLWRDNIDHNSSAWHTLDFSALRVKWDNWNERVRLLLAFSQGRAKSVTFAGMIWHFDHVLDRLGLTYFPSCPLYQILSSCPAIERLRLDRSRLTPGMVASIPNRESLRSMVVRDCSTGSFYFSQFLLLLPNVQELVFEDQCSGNGLWPPQANSLPNLQRVNLKLADTNSRYTLDLLANAAPNLRFLCIYPRTTLSCGTSDGRHDMDVLLAFVNLEELVILYERGPWHPPRLPESLRRLTLTCLYPWWPREERWIALENGPSEPSKSPHLPNLEELDTNLTKNTDTDSKGEDSVAILLRNSGSKLQKLKLSCPDYDHKHCTGNCDYILCHAKYPEIDIVVPPEHRQGNVVVKSASDWPVRLAYVLAQKGLLHHLRVLGLQAHSVDPPVAFLKILEDHPPELQWLRWNSFLIKSPHTA